MVTPSLTGRAVHVDARGGKDPLPHPLSAGVLVLPGQRGRQFHPTGAGDHVPRVLLTNAAEVPREVRLDDGRQHGRSVLVALAAPDDDLVGPEVDILDPEATAL